MRTPDSDQSDSGGDPGGGGAEGSGSADLGSLAEGFHTSETGDDGGTDDAFGTGWGSAPDPYDESYAVGDQDPVTDPAPAGDDPLASLEGGEALSAFEFEADYVPDTDSDWDVTGDGVVDGADLHEAATSVHDFHVDGDDVHDHAHHHDGGFFDG